MFNKKIKIGLALGGGGARGFTHLGAIKAFEEFGLKFDFVAGTSAGSLAGAFYSAGYSYKQMYDVIKNITEKDIRTNVIPFTTSKTDGIGDIIRKNLGDINIEDLEIPFAAVAVDIKSTNEVAISKGNLAKAVEGSCAVPGVFQPVIFDNMILSDGGLQNTIPADIPRLFGCDYVIAVDVNKSRTYGTDSTKFLDVIMCSIRILMKSNAVRGYVNADVVVMPETKRFKSTKTEGLEDMIEEGYKATIDVMPQIMEIFSRKKRSKFKFEPPKD
ncbi:MAG: patatin-like phospholipase family protein, partial [Clostridia bacterium]|nr:patatin-like phospholipase family protein [Clostridia bacterium]